MESPNNMIRHIIIPLPTGGHAIVRMDPVANTASVESHDGATVTRAAGDRLALALLAQVAAADVRPVAQLLTLYTHAENRDSLVQLDPQRADHIVSDFMEDTKDGTWNELRNYCQDRHATTKGDASWPEMWSSIQNRILQLAMAAEVAR